MDLLSSLGTIAAQISDSLRANSTENTRRVTGDATKVFDAIRREVEKPDGVVLNFVIEFNLNVAAALNKDADFGALSDVDQEYLRQFLLIGKRWREANGVVEEITHPFDIEIDFEDRIEALEEKVEELIDFVTTPDNAKLFSPNLPGVTRDMSLYPWDKEDPQNSRRRRLVAFGALAAQIHSAIENAPPAVKIAGGLLTLAGTVASILSLFLGG